MEYFQKPRDDGFVDALAVAQADTLKALEGTNQDERLQVFEAYAEQGLKKIDEMLQVKGQDALGAVLELLDLYGFGLGRIERLPGLEGLAERVAEQL